MERSPLDELVVPQPPYRMARPVAVLAAVGDELPPIPPVPAVEQPLVIPEQNLSLAEAIEQQEAAIETAAQAEKERLATDAPLEGAAPQESAQNEANKQEALLQLDIAAAEGGAAVRRTAPPDYSAIEGLMPDRTSEQRAADNALAEQLRQKQQASTEVASESVNERVARISKEAMAELNKFQTKPGEDTKESVQEVQRRLDAAKRGETFDADRYATVRDSDDVRRARATAQAELDTRAQEKPAEPEKPAEAPAAAPPSKAELRQQKFADKTEEKKKAQFSRDWTAALKEDSKRTDAKQAVQDQLDQERAVGEGMSELPVAEAESQKEDEPDFSNVQSWDELETAIRALADQEKNPGWLTLIPRVEEVRDLAQQVPPDQLSAELGVFSGSMKSTIERLLAADQQKNESAPPAPAAVEVAPKTREQGLEEENERLRAELEKLRQQAGSARTEQPVAAVPEREIGEAGRTPTGDFDKAAAQILADREKPGFFSQQWLNLQAVGNNVGRFWHSVLAKRSKDLLAVRKTRLEELEAEAEAFAGKGWKQTAAAALLYGPRINWYRDGVESAAASLEHHEENRKLQEQSRADLLNLVMVREEASLKSTEKRARVAAEQAKKHDTRIEGYYASHRKATEEYVASDDPAEKAEKLEEVKKFERLIQGVLKLRSGAQKKFTRENGQAAGIQAEHNVILRAAETPQQPDTSYSPRQKRVVRTKRQAAGEQAA